MDALDSQFDEFIQHMCTYLSKLNSTLKTQHESFERIKSSARETYDNLESLLEHLRQYDEATLSAADFQTFKLELAKTLEDRQRSRDLARVAKQEKKAIKTAVNEEASRLKAEIGRIMEENDKMSDELKSDGFRGGQLHQNLKHAEQNNQ